MNTSTIDRQSASDKPSLARELVLSHAQRLRDLLAPVCERVEIAGSLRREKDTVSDIEIVALPLARPSASLFDDDPAPFAPCEAFSALLARLQADGVLRLDPFKLRNGPRYKRFLVPEIAAIGFSLDLFIADPDNFGNTLAIRTGSAAFSQFLMTRAWTRSRRRQQDGYLWQCERGDSFSDRVPVGRRMISCPTEESYFLAVDVPYIEPRSRNEGAIHRIRKAGR